MNLWCQHELKYIIKNKINYFNILVWKLNYGLPPYITKFQLFPLYDKFKLTFNHRHLWLDNIVRATQLNKDDTTCGQKNKTKFESISLH